MAHKQIRENVVYRDVLIKKGAFLSQAHCYNSATRKWNFMPNIIKNHENETATNEKNFGTYVLCMSRIDWQKKLSVANHVYHFQMPIAFKTVIY